jgi:CTP synthase
MRLGKRCCVFQPDTSFSKFRALYPSATEIWERHRHRYEVAPSMLDRLKDNQEELALVGLDEKGERVEVVELRGHPWFVGVQFHPEYLSRVLAPSKTYLGFFAAAAGCLDQITAEYAGNS